MRYLFLGVMFANFAWIGSLFGQSDSALQSLRRGDFQKAIELLQQEVQNGFNLPESYFHFGLALNGAGEFARAIQQLERYVTLVPDKPDGWLQLGVAYFGQNRFDEASRSFEHSLNLDPAQPVVQKMLGKACFVSGRNELAEHAFTEAANLNPLDWEAPYLLGRFHQSTGNYAKAAEYLEKATSLNPKSARAFAFLGTIYHILEKNAEAAVAFEKAVELNIASGALSFVPHLEYGVYLQRTNRLEQSIEQLKRAAKLNPNSVEAYFEQARSLYRLGRLDEARRVLAEALEHQLQDSRLHFLLGRICYEQGDRACGDKHTALSQQDRDE